MCAKHAKITELDLSAIRQTLFVWFAREIEGQCKQGLVSGEAAKRIEREFQSLVQRAIFSEYGSEMNRV